MTPSGFAFRNATITWWRSLTLGAFIFAIAFVMTLFDSIGSAVRERVDNVVVRGLTGHVQIRSDKSREDDMVSFYTGGWDDITPLPASTVETAVQKARELFPEAARELRARKNVSLIRGSKRELSLLIGVEPGRMPGEDAFVMESGSRLQAGAENAASPGIILTREQAKNLAAGVGDVIQVVTRNAQGLTAERDLTVEGIGDFVVLSLFSYKACFTDIATARDLFGFDEGQATDVLVTFRDGAEASTSLSAPALGRPLSGPGAASAALSAGRSLSQALHAAGLPVVFQPDQKLTSSDIYSDEGMLPDQKEPDKVRVSTWQDMGKTVRGVGEAITVALAALAAFLMLVVSILIVNLVSLMGLERYREIGTLRAIGFPRHLVIRLFMTEIMGVATAAMILGAAAGGLAVSILGRTGIPAPVAALEFVMGKTLYPRLTAGGVGVILAIIWLFSLAASGIPAVRACSLRPAETLREK